MRKTVFGDGGKGRGRVEGIGRLAMISTEHPCNTSATNTKVTSLKDNNYYLKIKICQVCIATHNNLE